MDFVIVGTGRVGLRTARVLDDEGHAVTVVERDPVLVERARDDGFGVVTGDGSCHTVMRVDEDYREDVYRQYADEVDEVVYPERLGTIGAKNALLGGTIRAVADVAPHLQVVELTVSPEAPMRGYTVSELQLPVDATVLAFGKGEGPLVLPDPDESIEAGDRLVVLADFDVLDDVRQIVVGDDRVEVAEGGA
ncbi:potassium transporter Trk [Halobacteriales archaeon SW_7_71_33]|nr:MAG: potassium transporter Trk [Halobacteriales archaeon SW_7_71_33]